MITYSDSLATVTDADLEGFLAHWHFAPPTGTLHEMLRGSTAIFLARDDQSSTICGYVTALSDGIACAYISAIEVRLPYRNQGVGTALLSKMIQRLDVYGIYLSCAQAMVPFYESAGFHRVAGMAKRKIPATE